VVASKSLLQFNPEFFAAVKKRGFAGYASSTRLPPCEITILPKA
jgi:hypothetical protein